jgi:hypothetical protein
MMKMLMVVRRRKFRMEISEVEMQAGHGGFGNTAAEVDDKATRVQWACVLNTVSSPV